MDTRAKRLARTFRQRAGGRQRNVHNGQVSNIIALVRVLAVSSQGAADLNLREMISIDGRRVSPGRTKRRLNFQWGHYEFCHNFGLIKKFLEIQEHAALINKGT